MPETELCFETMIDPIDHHDFLKTYWEKNYLMINRTDPSYYGSVFSFADVDRWLHIAKESPQDVISIVPLSPVSDRSPRVIQGRDIDIKEIYQAFNGGATIQLAGVHRLWPPLVPLVGSLRDALNASISINAYMTPAESQGFSAHFDTHDVFVLQLDGSKDWHIYERYIDVPVAPDVRLSYNTTSIDTRPGEDKFNLIQQVRLNKGDLLYLPRGFPHKAVATDEGSLHLTVGVSPPYWVDLLKAAMESVCLEHAELRRALPPGFVDDPEIRAEMADVFREVLALASREASLESTLRELISVRFNKQDYPPDGHFAQITQIAKLTRESIVQRRRGLDCRILDSGNSVEIRFAKSSIRGPASIGPALKYIRDQQRFRIADLPGRLDDNSKLVLVRRFIREGLLRVEESPQVA